MVVLGRKLPLGKVAAAILILNEIRGAFVVAGVLWAWKPWQ